jgi:hypothetical protein
VNFCHGNKEGLVISHVLKTAGTLKVAAYHGNSWALPPDAEKHI